MVTIKEFMTVYESFVPKNLAIGKDPIGLHFGHPNQEITKMMTTLDVRPEVVQEAIENDVDFILAHHPPIFKPVARFDESDPQQKMYADIIRHNIGVYASHTNLDVVDGGMNDWLAEALKLKNIRQLSSTTRTPFFKLTVFVPLDGLSAVLSAAHEAGAGQVDDDYEDVSYAVKGKGRFTPIGEANPTIGNIGDKEVVEEERIEMLVKEADISQVIQAIKEAHPYEVPVYDIYKLEYAGDQQGIGRVGELENDMSLKEFIDYVSKTFDVSGLRYVQPISEEDIRVKTVAICGGDGGSFYKDVLKAKADVYITGDVYYHTAHDMQAAGLPVIDPGHHIESICIPMLANLVNDWKKEHNWSIKVIESKTKTEPFQFYKSN